MARASRSSKKQPDFDPSEIEDLIFSPAVGKGVGSHLVQGPSRPTVVVTDLTTVVGTESDLTTVVAKGNTKDQSYPSDVATVVTRDSLAHQATMGATDMATVAMSAMATQLWVTEHGDLVSAARVKKIRLAQDVINSAEESVYDTLWNSRLVSSDESSRLVQAGYDYLVKRTRLSRKTIQRIVAKLLEKDFIEVDTRADIYQRTATVYRVYSYKAVLDRNLRKGRLYVAKMGPGFSYARLLQSPEPSTGNPLDMPTVVTSRVSPVVIDDTSTMAKPTTVTVVKTDQPTVVKMSPLLLDSKLLDKSSSSSVGIRAALGNYGSVDDDVTAKLIAACRSYAPDCTDQEIVHFIHEKGKHVQRRDSRVHNPLGFLLTAVPKCFSGELLEEHRQKESRESDTPAKADAVAEDPALARWRKEQETALSDPSVSEQEKHLIRLCLGLNTR